VRGLEALVRGEGDAAVRPAPSSQPAPAGGRKASVPARPVQPPAAGRVRAAGKTSGGNGKLPPGMRPEDLIPLEEKSMAEF